MVPASKAVWVVVALTGVSAALGFARDSVIAAMFGASHETDVFFVASVVFNILVQIIVTGALVPAFLPVFSEILAKEKAEEASRVASSATNLLGMTLAAVSITFYFTAPFWATLIAPGFSSENLDQVTIVLRILSPGIVFLGLAGLFAAQLNSLNHFALPALGSGIVSLVVIIAIFVGAYRWGSIGLGVGTLAGTVLLFAVELPLVYRRVHYKVVLDLHNPALRRVTMLSLPLLAYLVIAQTPTFMERSFASHFPQGTVSWLNYAQKVTAIPNALFGSSVVVAMFPVMSKSWAMGLREEFREHIVRGLKLSSLMVIPFSVLLPVAGMGIIGALFERGQFRASDTESTAYLLIAYSFGIWPATIGAVFLRAFHAMQDMWTPLWIGLASTLAYLVLAVTLSKHLGAFGLGLSLSLTALISMLALGSVLQVRVGFFGLSSVVLPIAKILLISVFAVGIYALMDRFAIHWINIDSSFSRVYTVLLSLTISGIFFVIECFLMKIDEVVSIVSRVVRAAKATTP